MELVKIDNDLNYKVNSENTSLNFVIDSNKEVNLFVDEFESLDELIFDVRDYSILHLSLFAKKSINSLKITANIGENSKIIVHFADFSVEKHHLDAAINLNKNNASAEWHLASLSTNKDDKEISVSIYHNHSHTNGKIDNYGVCKDNSKLIFSGISHIIKGCHESSSHQNAKIVVFDNDCKAIAKPILKIDENDIEASHAAVVGKVSDDHIFYLTSRGLSKEEAKMLITLGYLKPILKGFDENVANDINQLIEGRL